ncbi:acetyl-CoA carboxylase biotin carboxyl carrier protein [Francisellaceae bacterium]|nr:acetyl-CoA carboxylase biotin carboxyl carrier protein [Francisellaceae bacterium]MDA7742088.1 acetyl-CoA carboxylase biotin carboxyl carrier protein [Francisellaceae bacterium]
MDMRKIERLIKLVDDSTVSEVEIKDGETTLRVTRNLTTQAVMTAPQQLSAPQQFTETQAAAPLAQTMPESNPEPALPTGDAIRSPMVGTFYSAASPDSADFVKVGDKVNVGDTLCIIEAMKIMNQIEAETSGTIVEALLQSGDPVEYDQPLFIIQ